MKKLLFLLLMLPGLAFGATRTWSSAASTNMNLATNYDGAGDLLITDDLVFNNTSVVNAAATAALSVNSVTIASTYTGTWALTGYTLTCATGFSDDGITGAHNYGNGITCNGASNTFHVGAGVASVTAASCVLTMNGTTAMVCDIDKATAFGPLTLGAAAVVTYSGAAVNTFYSTTTPLIIGNGASLTVNNADVYFRRATLSGDIYSLPAAYTLNGNAGIHFEIGTAGLTMNAPAFTYAGTGNIYFSIYSNRANTVWNQTGNINTGVAALYFYISNAANIHTHTTNGYSVTCGVFYSDIQTAGGVMTLNCGASVFTVSQFAASWNNAGYALNMQTSTWFCSGNLTFGSNHTINPGTSLVTLNGSAAQSITSNGKSFYDLTVNNTGTAFVTRADSLTCHDLTLTDGPWNSATYGIRADDFIHSSTDSVRVQNVWLTGNYIRSAGATKSDTAGQHIRFLAGTSHTMAAAGKTYAKVTLNGPTAINGGATIALLSYGVDGVKGRFEAAKKVTLDSLSIGGASGSLDTTCSSVPGSMDTLSCPQDTPAYVYTIDQYMVNPRYLPATSISGGNNHNVKTLSYTGVTKDISSGAAGATVTFTGPGFIGDCWVKIGTDSSALTVVSYTSATKAVPALLAAGVYAMTVGNSDANLASVGNFTITAAGGSTRKAPYGYGYKRYRY